MRYAVYRCLYGEDFIQESINSITDYVDKIFVFWDEKPWGDIKQCTYKGEVVKFPEKFDNIVEKIKELKNPKIHLIYDHQTNNINQFTHFLNDIILPNHEKPDTLIMLEVDYVYRKDQIEKALELFEKSGYQNATTRQIEIWKGLKHYLPERERFASMLWNLKNLDKMPPTGRHANSEDLKKIDAFVHNFGFAVSEKTMYWKHMTALGFYQEINDSPPNEDWYEEKWLKWDYETNNKDLEISKGAEYLIPKAMPYNTDELPEQMKVFL